MCFGWSREGLGAPWSLLCEAVWGRAERIRHRSHAASPSRLWVGLSCTVIWIKWYPLVLIHNLSFVSSEKEDFFLASEVQEFGDDAPRSVRNFPDAVPYLSKVTGEVKSSSNCDVNCSWSLTVSWPSDCSGTFSILMFDVTLKDKTDDLENRSRSSVSVVWVLAVFLSVCLFRSSSVSWIASRSLLRDLSACFCPSARFVPTNMWLTWNRNCSFISFVYVKWSVRNISVSCI